MRASRRTVEVLWPGLSLGDLNGWPGTEVWTSDGWRYLGHFNTEGVFVFYTVRMN